MRKQLSKKLSEIDKELDALASGIPLNVAAREAAPKKKSRRQRGNTAPYEAQPGAPLPQTQPQLQVGTLQNVLSEERPVEREAPGPEPIPPEESWPIVVTHESGEVSLPESAAQHSSKEPMADVKENQEEDAWADASNVFGVSEKKESVPITGVFDLFSSGKKGLKVTKEIEETAEYGDPRVNKNNK